MQLTTSVYYVQNIVHTLKAHKEIVNIITSGQNGIFVKLNYYVKEKIYRVICMGVIMETKGARQATEMFNNTVNNHLK